MIDELKRIWKEAVMVYSRYDPIIRLEGLKRATNDLRQDITGVPALPLRQPARTPPCMAREYSLQCSQDPATVPCLEPDESDLQLSNRSLHDLFNISRV
jgi:hypothetical protein